MKDKAPVRRKKRSAKTIEQTEPSPRVVRRERRRERSREEIVQAARAILIEKGIGGTTLDAVAQAVGLTKAALYYYYPSKDALLFEVMFTTVSANAHAVHDAVARAADGPAALRAIIRETVAVFAPRLDDFRLAFLHGQVAGPGAVQVGAEQLAQVRPLNDLIYAGATKMLSDDWKRLGRGRARVDPRMMAFLANIAAVGLLTFKGMVESVGDPLRYSDEELVEGLARIFEAAARA